MLSLRDKLETTPREFLTFAVLPFVCSVTLYFVAEKFELNPEPFWLALPFLSVPVAMIMIRWPAALIPLILFVGSFKMTPADSNWNLRDPTMWVLLILLVTMLVHALLAFVGIEKPSLGERVRGQFVGILTFLIFAGAVALSYSYSRAPEYGFRAMTHFTVIGSITYFSTLFLLRSESDIRHLITSTLLLGVALTVQEFVTRQPETVKDPTRLDAGFQSSLALLLLLLAPRSMRASLPQPLLLFCIPALGAGLAISLARGPALSFIVIVVLSLLTSRRQIGLLPRTKLVVMLFLFLGPAVIMSFSWLQHTASNEFGKKGSELSSLLNFSDPGGTIGERLELYQLAIRGFAEKPVLGWGIGSFSVFAKGTDMAFYPHNLVLLVAMEQGLVGLAALGAFATAVGFVLRKTVAATKGEWVFLRWTVVYCFSAAMFSGSLDDQRELVLWCGIAFSAWRMLKLRFDHCGPEDEFSGTAMHIPETALGSVISRQLH